MNTSPTLHTKKEAAKLLRLSLRSIDNLLSARAIECIRIGRAVRFAPEAIERFKQSRTVKATA